MKIKLKPKAFEIDLVIYPYSIFVCFLDLKKLIDTMSKYKYSNPSVEEMSGILSRLKDGSFVGRCIQCENGNIILYFPYRHTKVETLSHEAFHATHMIMDNIGLKLSFESDEAFCYLNGYINQKIFEQI